MQTQNLISADEFCTHYKVEYSFIDSLYQFGLIDFTTIEETNFIETERLIDLERFARLHYDLEINLEGIEAISFLLEKVKSLHNEITVLKNKLSLYEQNKFEENH